MRFGALLVATATALTGCASTMSGLDAKSEFSCAAPDGVTCTSLSGVYANAIQNNLPSQNPHRNKAQNEAGDDPKSANRLAHGVPVPVITGKVPTSGDPVRSPVQVVRVWLAPWEDEFGDLHDQSYIYMVLNFGKWNIEHNRAVIKDRYRPTFKQVVQKAPEQSSEQKDAEVPRKAQPVNMQAPVPTNPDLFDENGEYIEK